MLCSMCRTLFLRDLFDLNFSAFFREGGTTAWGPEAWEGHLLGSLGDICSLEPKVGQRTSPLALVLDG